jgi:diguanylate cyclase (GGDEF)-like protein
LTNLNPLREKIYTLLSPFRASEVIALAGGVVAVVTGVLLDYLFIRIICLLVLIGSAVIMYVLQRRRHSEDPNGGGFSSSLFDSQTENDGMKKLIFDDLQSARGGRYEIGVDETPDPAPAPRREYRDEAPERQAARDERAGDDRGEPAHAGRPADDADSAGMHPHPVVRHGTPVTSPAMAAAMSGEPAPHREFAVTDFFDFDSEIFKGETEPRTEFDFLLVKLLGVVKEVLFAHSVSFFWANREKQQMVLETKVTDSLNYITARRFAIGHDLVSRVAATGRPEVLTEVNPDSEGELFPYYTAPEGIRSFVGVPVFYSKSTDPRDPGHPVAVIAVDSVAEDDFGDETVAVLGHATKLVSALIKSYNDKYDLLLNAELIRSIRRMQEKIRANFSLETIVQSLSDEITKMIGWDHLSVVLYDEQKHNWAARRVTSRGHAPFIAANQVIDIAGSVTGRTIRNNIHSLVEDLETVTFPRYYPGEKVSSSGSFVSVPISSLNKCYGAVSLESADRYNFSRQDIEILYRLTENVGSAIELLYLNDVINDYVVVDALTGLYSKKYFAQRLNEEIQRADDTGTELSLLYVNIDKHKEIVERYGDEGFERVVLALARLIRSGVRPYDVVGRVETNRLGVLLAGTTSSDAYLWAEKIRKNIAGQVITIGEKSFSVTISAGVSGVLEGMRSEELIGNTIAVLNRATEAGGNTVRVF